MTTTAKMIDRRLEVMGSRQHRPFHRGQPVEIVRIYNPMVPELEGGRVILIEARRYIMMHLFQRDLEEYDREAAAIGKGIYRDGAMQM